MAGCRLPFGKAALWPPEPAPLVLPAANGLWNGVKCVVELYFPQEMDTLSSPDATDFTLKYDAEIIAGNAFAWMGSAICEVEFPSIVEPLTNGTIDYVKGVTPLRTLDLKEYDSWSDLFVSFGF
jgi:hypothetical protein